MIWALLAMYFFGGGVGSGAVMTSAGVDDLTDRVAIVVEDEARRENAAATLKDLKKDVRAFEKVFAKTGKQLSKQYKDHAVGRDAALVVLDQLNAEWANGQQQALDARFALRETLTESEWRALFADDR